MEAWGSAALSGRVCTTPGGGCEQQHGDTSGRGWEGHGAPPIGLIAQESTTLPHSSDFLTPVVSHQKKKELLNAADLCAKSLAPTLLCYSLKMALS